MLSSNFKRDWHYPRVGSHLFVGPAIGVSDRLDISSTVTGDGIDGPSGVGIMQVFTDTSQ